MAEKLRQKVIFEKVCIRYMLHRRGLAQLYLVLKIPKIASEIGISHIRLHKYKHLEEVKSFDSRKTNSDIVKQKNLEELQSQ